MVAKRTARCPACGLLMTRGGLCVECRKMIRPDGLEKRLRAAARQDTARQRRILIYAARADQRLPLFEPHVE